MTTVGELIECEGGEKSLGSSHGWLRSLGPPLAFLGESTFPRTHRGASTKERACTIHNYALFATPIFRFIGSGERGMAEFPKLPLWTDAYLADTRHLTTLEHGAYLLLLMAMWRTKGTCLPHDHKLLARFAGLTRAQWDRIAPTIMLFFDVEDGKITQGRLTDEANAVRQHSQRQSDRSKVRWLKNKKNGNAVALPDRCQTDATLSLSLSTGKETDAKASSKKNGERFDAWYKNYPRKVGRGAAKKSFERIMAQGIATPEELSEGLARYIRTKPPTQAWCHPATWLNQERWADRENPGNEEPREEDHSLFDPLRGVEY